MIYADLDYAPHYSELHEELVALVENHFDDVQHGLQGDSWIWIFEGGEKVAIDTFYSMKHQVKSDTRQGRLVQKVIALLAKHYRVEVYPEPGLEAHED